ncbi:MAG: hypothetical protein LBS36_04585 [Oscillospiraceae bacterium]|nr:hypothetical protein [Oscillospiraceae bacterium]
MKRILSLLLIFIFIFLSACKKDDDPTTAGASGAQTTGGTGSTLVETTPQTTEKGKNIIGTYSVKRATELYIEAANKVKEAKAGFTKSEWQAIKDIKTPDTTGLADRILDIVTASLITSEDNAFGKDAMIVEKGSTQRINLLFPIYNQPYAANLNMNYDCIESAEYKKEDGKYKISLYFKEVQNAEREEPGFGSIMVPFIRGDVLENLRRYLVVADLEKLALDFNYKNCYLTCVIDATTMQMESLDMHIYADLNASADINVLGIVKTDFLNGTATVEDHMHFYNFMW